MAAPSKDTNAWPMYSVRVEVTYLGSVPGMADSLEARMRPHPDVVFFGATPQDTGLPGFGGELNIRFRSRLGQKAATDLVREMFEAEGLNAKAVTSLVEDLGTHVVEPSVSELRDVAGTGAAAVKAANESITSITVIVVAVAAIVVLPQILALFPKRKARG